MALSTAANKVTHNGNGVATSFAFTFPVHEATHLSVIHSDTGGNAVTLSPGLYSVTGIGVAAGGSVTYPLSGPPLANGETLTILRTVPLTQNTVLSNQGGYYPEVVERRFDHIYMALQQLDEEIGRATLDPPSVQRADVVATLEDLKALTTRPAAVLVKTGRGADTWQWEAGSTTTADDALVVNPPSGAPGRYKRIIGESVEAGWFLTSQAAADTAHGKVFGVPPASTVMVAVPSQQADINAAIDAVRQWTIPQDATVNIIVAGGTYDYTEALTFDHPFGARIFVDGDIATPSNCELRFTGNIPGVYVAMGRALGGFNGFRLVKQGTMENLGVIADIGAIVRCGPALEIDNFYYGLAARSRSLVNANGTAATSGNRVLVTNAGDVGIWSFVGSTLNCRYAKVDTVEDVPNNLGFGFMAEYGSAMDCEFAEATGCRRAGFASYSGSGMRAYSTNTHDNGGNGYEAKLGGSLTAHSGFSTNNGGWGALSDGYGRISASPAITYSLNVSGTYREPLDFDGSDNVSFRGNMRTVKASPEIKAQATTGDALLTTDAAAGAIGLWRVLIASAERGRIQYRDDFDLWEWNVNGKTLLRAFDTGKVTVGVGNPATTDTTGFLQIPSCNGAPTGVVTDIQPGYVGLVWDRSNKKFMVYDGAWLGGTNPGVFT